MATNHVLLTRFNLPSGGVENLIRVREGWMRKRVELFERYCAPSVEAQTRRDVRWIVYFDPESPAWLLEWARPYAERGLFRPILRDSVPREHLLADIAETVEDKRDFLITTNLDNDDALASDFAERVGSTRLRHAHTVVYLSKGLIKGEGGVYLRTDRRNAFCSVAETWERPVTCWGEYHNLLPTIMPSVELRGAPGWLQVVHGDNVSNRVRGRLVSPTGYGEGFGDLLDDVAEPTRRELSEDLLVGWPGRLVRDGARTAARAAAIKVLGKERFGQAKLAVHSVLRSR